MQSTKRILMLCLLGAPLLLQSAATEARVKPIYNIVDKPIVSGSGKPLTMEQVSNALASAARYKNWTVVEEGEGHLGADIQVRQHYAAIDIRYTTDSYSITYKDSKVLKYDGTRIHRNYNKWIKLIEQVADQNFAAL